MLVFVWGRDCVDILRYSSSIHIHHTNTQTLTTVTPQVHGTNNRVLVHKIPRELGRPHARLLLRCCHLPSPHLHSGSAADEPPHAPLQRCLLSIRNRCPGVDLEGAIFLHPRTLRSRILGSCEQHIRVNVCTDVHVSSLFPPSPTYPHVTGTNNPIWTVCAPPCVGSRSPRSRPQFPS